MYRFASAVVAALIGMLLVGLSAGAASRSATVKQVHRQTCPTVVEYLSCASLDVQVGNYGNVGWTGSSSPAAGVVRYNTYYNLTRSGWAQTVAHEVGGHHDTWAELVAKVGTSKAWTDYYEIDSLAVAFFQQATGRTFGTSMAKEMWLDCAGPIAHGYPGYYLQRNGVPATGCTGWHTVVDRAVAS